VMGGDRNPRLKDKTFGTFGGSDDSTQGHVSGATTRIPSLATPAPACQRHVLRVGANESPHPAAPSLASP